MTEYRLQMKLCKMGYDEKGVTHDSVEIPDDAIALEVDYHGSGKTYPESKKAYIKYLEPVETD